MDVRRDSARTWHVNGHPMVDSVEISEALERYLSQYAATNDSGWVMTYNGRPIERIIAIILNDMKNPERHVSFGEMDLSSFKSASTR